MASEQRGYFLMSNGRYLHGPKARVRSARAALDASTVPEFGCSKHRALHNSPARLSRTQDLIGCLLPNWSLELSQMGVTLRARKDSHIEAAAATARS